jgi:hypothetical protein
MSKERLNIELFKAIREKIATTPGAYDQSRYARETRRAPCGTAACIAGWACVLSGAMDAEELKRRERSDADEFALIDITAKGALRVDDDEAEILFTENPAGERRDWDEDDDEHEGGWPQPFAGLWDNDRDAATAVAYLDHIIETGSILE